MEDRLALPENLWFELEPASPQECPYLPNREIQLGLGLMLPDAPHFDRLLARGCRRLGQIFYLPACAGCRECLPIRVPLATFAPSRSQRRLWRRVADRFEVRLLPPTFEEAHFQLYHRHSLHVSDDNTPGGPESYVRAFLLSTVETRLVEYRVDEQLVALSIIDEGEKAISSVYTCWDPDQAHLSPGTFSALWEMRWARDAGKEHYYLGYYIAECSRMNYKNRFRPYELLDWSRGEWGVGDGA
ncbi:MAG: arginyltransferase [Deltaproteobacteria bacterium]|nr:arginyltransferase [Deltaproteobacteria bacterium]